MPHDDDDRFCLEACRLLLPYVRHLYPGFSREDVEDVVEDTFAAYLQYRRKHAVPNAIALLYTIARCTAANLNRRKKLRGEIQGEAAAAVLRTRAAPAEPPRIDPVELALFLTWEWFTANRPADLPILELRAQELTHEEIAVRLSLSPDVVRQRFSRAVRAIRGHASQLGIDECMELWREEGGGS